MPKWPFKSGFSFCTWLRIESLPSATAAAPSLPSPSAGGNHNSNHSNSNSSAAGGGGTGVGKSRGRSRGGNPHLFSFLTSDGKGIELFIRQDTGVLHMQVAVQLQGF